MLPLREGRSGWPVVGVAGECVCMEVATLWLNLYILLEVFKSSHLPNGLGQNMASQSLNVGVNVCMICTSGVCH